MVCHRTGIRQNTLRDIETAHLGGIALVFNLAGFSEGAGIGSIAIALRNEIGIDREDALRRFKLRLRVQGGSKDQRGGIAGSVLRQGRILRNGRLGELALQGF